MNPKNGSKMKKEGRIMKSIRLALIGLVVCLACVTISGMGLAAEAEAAAPTLGEALRAMTNETIIPLIVAVVGAMLSLVLGKLKAKYNIQLQTETQAWIERQADAAVRMVSEKAAAKIKWEKIRISSNEKLEMAIAALVSRVPAITPDQADLYVHAALARIKGEGASA
jgi:TM2 domain-containing membrane protein YozV